MPSVICKICNQNFSIKPNRIAKGWGKYCSNACKHQALKSGQFKKCANCGNKTYKNIAEINRSKSNRFFCSKSCLAIWRNSHVAVGSNHPNWITGQSSYRDILKRHDPRLICNKCASNDLRTLAVHHRDKNRLNNVPENLVWLCHNCHFLVHHYPDESPGFLD